VRSFNRSALLRRSGWGLADQGISSLGNIVLLVLVARAVSTSEFGAFGLAFTTYVLLVGVARSLTSDPLAVRYSAADDASAVNEAIKQSVGLGCLLGIVAGAATAIVGLLLGGLLGSTLLVFALVLPGLLVQDAWRLAFFVSGRPMRAAINDAVWTFLQVSFIAFLLWRDSATVSTLVLAWGLTGNVAAILGAFQAHLLPTMNHPTRWLRAHSDLVPSFLVEFFAASGAQQAVLYIVAAFAGLAAVGAIRAALMVLGPLNILFSSARVVYIPEGVRLAGQSGRTLLRGMVAVSLILVLCATGWGTLLLLLPDRVGFFLLGSTWIEAQSVLMPLIILKIGTAAAIGAIVGLRALARAKLSAALRISLGLATLALGSGGALLADGYGAATGMAIVSSLAVAVWWGQFGRAI